jgi:membrane protease YdiL (CAAX protease family)
MVSCILLIFIFALVMGEVVARWGLSLDPSLVINLGTLLLLLPVWYFTIFKYGASWADLGLRAFRPALFGFGCLLMIAAMVFTSAYGWFLGLFGLQIQPDIAPLFTDTTYPFAIFVGGAVVAPFVEEVFFRGFVFAGLRGRWPWKTAMLLSAGLFALAHILPTSILPIFILGVIFAYLYQISGSIWPAIIMHMLTNILALSVAYALSQGWLTPP